MTRRLHIGGTAKCAGWEILNANPAPYVDHVCNANDLSRFGNETFEQLYSSHVVEHLDYKDELFKTLVEWNRVLKPGGTIFISVPDLDILSGLLLQKDRLSIDGRFAVMRMMFGGHVDKYDYHVVGLNQEFLESFLHSSGFANMRRVHYFGIFEDTSSMIFAGVPISLNMIAEKRRS
jgi:predicted SAM-dependent methyltransferase